MDLKALSKRAKPAFRNVEELRALPILYVLERAGVAYEDRDGFYTCKNPFRPDNHPSFDVFGEKLERWGDFAEGSNGDVLDLLQRFAPDRRFVEIKDWASRLLDECQGSGWSGPTEGGERKVFDLEKARAYVNNVLVGFDAHDALADFLAAREGYLYRIHPSFLIERFKVGWDGERLVIPYVDRAGKLRWYKTRRPDGPVRAPAGHGYDTIFYGEHLDTDPARAVVLCEGESDVWSGTHAAGQRGFVFLGLPTGAGTLPTGLAASLAGRRVVLAFDGDLAGRTATATWTVALVDAGCRVWDLNVPEGEDLSTLSEESLLSGLDRVTSSW